MRIGAEAVLERRVAVPAQAPVRSVAVRPTEGATAPDIRFTGPTTSVETASVALESVAALIGRPAFLRIARRDGRSEILAADIIAVNGASITLGYFDVDAAKRLAGPGDDFWVHAPKLNEGLPTITLNSGDELRTAVALPLQIGAMPRASAPRLELRTRAHAIANGAGAPSFDVEELDQHIARDAGGAPYVLESGRKVLTASAAADVKAEQNAIVMALAGPLTEMFVKAARIGGVTAEVTTAAKPFQALEDQLRDLSTATTARFVRGLVREPDAPLGKAWRRLVVVHGIAQNHLPGVIVSDSPTRLLDQGMVTPIDLLGRLAEVARHFAARDGLATADILRASTPLIMKLAATHQQILASVAAGLEDGAVDKGRWSPAHFRLADNRLELTSDFIAHLAATRGARFDALPAKTTGCPAAQTFAGANPVRDFIEVFAELVEQLDAKRV